MNVTMRRVIGFLASLVGCVILYLCLTRPILIPANGEWNARAIVSVAVQALIIGLPLFLFLFLIGTRLVRWLVVLTVCLSALACWLVIQAPGTHSETSTLIGNSTSHASLRTTLVSILLISPIIWLFCYHRASLLTRHVFHEFFAPFLFSLVAFFSIWLIFDLSDNLPDFRKGDIGLRQALSFYVFQVPLVFTQIAQPAFLISIVYCLSRLSKANEILAMLSSGRSLFRIVFPLLLSGLAISSVYAVCNFEWAPRAEGQKEAMLKQFKLGEKQSTIAERQMYVNTVNNRTWYIGLIPFDLKTESLRTVDVFERSESNHLQRVTSAVSAQWLAESQNWVFRDCVVANYDETGLLADKTFEDERVVSGWSETPWLLVRGKIDPEYLGAPQLDAYLALHRDRPGARTPLYATMHQHRWAAPWSCVALFFIAAPLGISHSRRGALGGIALAILVFAVVMFLTEMSLALGQSGHMQPLAAAWLPNLVLLLIGGVCFWAKAKNRSLSLRALLST